MITFPCGVCKKTVVKNHKAIECTLCGLWVHIKCNNLDKKDYAFYQDVKNEHEPFFCINCISDNIPYSVLNNTEFSISVKKGVINSEEKHVDFVPSAFQQNMFDQLNAAINNNAFDLDADSDNAEGEVITTIDCQYYSVDDFPAANFNPSKKFLYFALQYTLYSMSY